MMIMIVDVVMGVADEEESVDADEEEIKEMMKKKKLLNLQVYSITLGMTHQLKP